MNPLVAALEAQSGIAFTEEERRLFEDSRRWSEPSVLRAHEWTKDLVALARDLAAGGVRGAEVSMFWIRLHGLFADLGPYFDRGAALFRSWLLVSTEVLAVRTVLSPDEVLFVEYARNAACHPFTDYLRVQCKKPRRGTVPAVVSEAYNGTPVRQIRAALDRVLDVASERWGVHAADAEDYVARGLAERLAEPLGRLLECVRRWRDE